MASPHDRKYLQTHEWHKPEGGLVTIGLTQFAVDELTDITYVDIAKAQGAIKTGESFGEIESVKATSDLYCGIDGAIVEVNQNVLDDPSIINQDPFDRGWLIKVEPSDTAQLDAMMTAAQYDQENH